MLNFKAEGTENFVFSAFFMYNRFSIVLNRIQSKDGGVIVLETAKYKRVVLKLSGESLAGDQGFGINPPVVEDIASQIKKIREHGVDVAVVVGGGNIWRGLAGSAKGMDRAAADYMGMMATVMNALAKPVYSSGSIPPALRTSG